MQTAPSDIEIWNAFKSGDRKAFGELFNRFYSPLFQYGSKICTDKAILEDCIQELFLEMWQSRSTIEVRSVRAYLIRSVKYKIFKLLRKKQLLHPVTEETTFEISYENLLIGRQVQEEQKQHLLKAINQLSARQKEIIYLKLYKALSYEELSEVMEINYQAARNLFSQAIKCLRSFLQ